MLKDYSILDLEKELEARKLVAPPMSEGWPESPVGWWEVTTEGDVEGRSTTKLGTYHGHVSDIALKLADKVCYSLRFIPAPEPPKLPETAPRKSVNISLAASSGMCSLGADIRGNSITEWLANAPSDATKVEVSKCRYYGAVTLTND